MIAFDQRGHGRSDAGGTVSVEQLGRDLQAVLEATVPDGDRACLVGHSMGGMTVMSWAALFPGEVPKRAAAVLLANTAAKRLAAETEILPFAERFGYVRHPALQALIGIPAPAPPARLSRGVVRRLALSPQAPDDAVLFTHQVIASCPPMVRSRWARAFNGLDLTAGVRNLSVPTTVLAGRMDRLTPVSTSMRIAEILAETGHLERSVVLDGVGHCANLEAVEEFNAVLDGMVAAAAEGQRNRGKRRRFGVLPRST